MEQPSKSCSQLMVFSQHFKCQIRKAMLSSPGNLEELSIELLNIEHWGEMSYCSQWRGSVFTSPSDTPSDPSLGSRTASGHGCHYAGRDRWGQSWFGVSGLFLVSVLWVNPVVGPLLIGRAILFRRVDNDLESQKGLWADAFKVCPRPMILNSQQPNAITKCHYLIF